MLNDKDVMTQVVDEIMTDMFFIFPDLDDDGQQVTADTASDESIHVGIHFNTDFYLHFTLDNALLEEMAGNFLGIGPDEIAHENLESMACETANIIGGNYLVKVDPSHQYKLSIPEVLDPSTIEDVVETQNPWKISFVADGRVMTISPYKRKQE